MLPANAAFERQSMGEQRAGKARKGPGGVAPLVAATPLPTAPPGGLEWRAARWHVARYMATPRGSTGREAYPGPGNSVPPANGVSGRIPDHARHDPSHEIIEGGAGGGQALGVGGRCWHSAPPLPARATAARGQITRSGVAVRAPRARPRLSLLWPKRPPSSPLPWRSRSKRRTHREASVRDCLRSDSNRPASRYAVAGERRGSLVSRGARSEI